jgi:hypothetical protein
MVEQTMRELGVLVIKVEGTFGSDMHRNLAGDQAGLIFLA